MPIVKRSLCLLVAFSMGTILMGCATNRERIGTTGVLGCAPEPLTDAEVGRIREAQASIVRGVGAIVPNDDRQVVQYLGRCGALDPVTGERIGAPRKALQAPSHP